MLNEIIRVWVNGDLVVESDNLFFRRTPRLKIDGIMFSSFFGGSKPIYASKTSSFIDFKDLIVSY